MGDDTGPHGLTGRGRGGAGGVGVGVGVGGGGGGDPRFTTPHRGGGGGVGIAEGRTGDAGGRGGAAQTSAQAQARAQAQGQAQAHSDETLLSPSGFYNQPVAFVGSLVGQAVAVPVGGMRTASDLIVSNSPFKM